MGLKSFLFTNPVNMLLARNLDVQSRQISAISSNLANIDTPGYKAVEVDFDSAFNREMNEMRAGQLRTTNPRHIGFSGETGNSVPMMEQENDSLRVDGNTVDLDKELMRLAMAQLQYSVAVNAMSKKGGIVKASLESKF